MAKKSLSSLEKTDLSTKNTKQEILESYHSLLDHIQKEKQEF